MIDITVPEKHVQRELFKVDRQAERDGIEMGVLENGIPYLSERGLARMCGIQKSTLNHLALEWEQKAPKPRILKIANLLSNFGYNEPTLYLKSEHRGVEVNAYTEPVCLALLEYYAFLAEEQREEAQNAFRVLARSTFRQFIYAAVGYATVAENTWKYFHDRVALNYDVVPQGFFSIFKEIAGLFVTLINNGVPVSEKIVPDISVGRLWSDYWKNTGGDAKYQSVRMKYNHNYPDYFPQAYSNHQESWCYPNDALGLFRNWFELIYLPSNFPKYMLSHKEKIGKAVVEQAINAICAAQKLQLPK